MGPFKDGAEAADGLSLLPLLDGEVDSLERTVVREERSGRYADAPAWQAIRTTASHLLGRWHYTEWATGERELYDTMSDPWELTNLARDDRYGQVVAQLASDLDAEFSRPVAIDTETDEADEGT